MKKIILWSALFIFSLWFVTYAGNIEFSPSEWSFGKWCVFGVDVNINTDGVDIAAFDLYMETSLKFSDFVPSKMFPYYVPPITTWNLVHLIWFATDPNNRINGSWSIWKIYFKSNPGDSDGAIKIYFAGKWETIDSNLSIPWWVDILTSVKDWYYTFTSDWECLSENDIIWWYHWVSYESWLALLTDKISADYKKNRMIIFWERIWITWVSIIILLLLLWYLHKKWYLVRHKIKASHN